MKWESWLEQWGMTALKLKTPFLEMEWKPQDVDKYAAWELYVELLTRTATQALDKESGDEQTALESIYALFDITRQVLKNHRACREFAKIAIVVLNQVIRPFTTKWHKESMHNDCFNDKGRCEIFRMELEVLQIELRKYTGMLADMAGVEDLTGLEQD